MDGLGINPVLIVAQIISFLVLWFVMNKFLYKKIKTALEERRNSIKEIYSDKAKLESRLLALEKEQEEKRKELLFYKKKVESEAKAMAEEIKKEMMSKARTASEREASKTRERITQEINSARNILSRETMIIAARMAEKIIADQSKNREWQKKELDKSLSEMRKKK
jgi:F-type H+-transporting ATPase subunit b